MKVKNWETFTENKKELSDADIKLKDKVEKAIKQCNLDFYESEYWGLTADLKYGLNHITWENPYAIGTHPANARAYTNVVRKGFIGSKQLEKLAKKLRIINNSLRDGSETGLYYDGTLNWYVFIDFSKQLKKEYVKKVQTRN